MSQARCNARRRRQAANGFANGFAHMSGDRRRPRYHIRRLDNIADAIAIERARAARAAQIKK